MICVLNLKIYDLTDLLTFIFSKKALFYRSLTGRRYTEAARISTYVFDVDVNLFTEDAWVACAAVSKSVSLNSIDIIKKVEGVCKQWSKRKLTLIGRITIKKSLAFAKFIHLLLALSKSPDDFLKTIERIFYNFLWNGGPDRIKRIVIVKNLKAGGLRMVNISEFINALKFLGFIELFRALKMWNGILYQRKTFMNYLAADQDTL